MSGRGCKEDGVGVGKVDRVASLARAPCGEPALDGEDQRAG
jgi:hypothetical protein